MNCLCFGACSGWQLGRITKSSCRVSALIVRTDRGGRALTDDEKKKLVAEYPAWMLRLADFADETCLSQGDLLRLTEEMIDYKAGIIRLEHGRRKTGVEQVPPLTLRCREILAEIEAERKQSKIRNVHGLIFTHPEAIANHKGVNSNIALIALSQNREFGSSFFTIIETLL